LKYRLVVIDLDGTLVDQHGEIAAEDKAAVTRLANQYVKVSLCTGRILPTTLPYILDLNLATPHIMFDGALIFSPIAHATISAVPLPPETVKEAVEYCRAEAIYLELYSRDFFFAERENWSDDIHRKFFRVEPTFVSFDGIWDREKLLKAEMVVGSPEDAEKVKKFADHFNGRISYSVAHTPAYPEVEFFNIKHPEVNKGAALKRLMDEMGVHPTEVIAIGDGLNDIPLLQQAGHAVAMGDAPDEVKAVCQYNTLDVEHHGVAEAINYFFPV
jgi:Cof subfamily protein (haloacid dehalogenase superfamily)